VFWLEVTVLSVADPVVVLGKTTGEKVFGTRIRATHPLEPDPPEPDPLEHQT